MMFASFGIRVRHSRRLVINFNDNIRNSVYRNNSKQFSVFHPCRTSVDVVKKENNDDKGENEFGTIDLPIDEKIVFNKFDFEPADNDAQDEHDAKIADIYRPNSEQFLRKINYLIHEKRDLKKALNIFETEMREERVKPEQAHYRILIHSCAQVGHAKKAFQLYYSFKKRQIKRHVGIFTDLFLSCSMCPDKQYALTQAQWLRKQLAEEHFIPNKVLYHSMIQAFGRTGDLETAFELIDEMRKNQVPVTHETFDFLLQGCISDKEHGFRHALLTWRWMRRKSIWPRIHNYNLMLKAAHDCGLGDVKYSRDILLACLPVHKQEELHRKEEVDKKRKAKPKFHKEYLEIVTEEEKNTELGLVPFTEIPNLLEKRPPIGDNIVSLAPEDNPQNRLMLMGGMTGLMMVMKRDRVSPNIKTFDQLLRVIPNNLEAETELLELMKGANVKPDVSFCNQLIILREKRGDLKLAKSTVDWMTEELELTPNIMTYGALARCCKDPATVMNFVKDFNILGLKLNTEIMDTLISSMAVKRQVETVEKLLKICVQHNVKVNTKLLNTVERFYQTYRKFVRDYEMGNKVPPNVYRDAMNEWKWWISFVDYYKVWLVQVKPDLSRNNLDQYKTIKDVKDEEYNAKHKIKT